MPAFPPPPPANPTTFAASPLDRAAHRRCDPAWLAAAIRDPKALILPLWKLQPFVIRAGGRPSLGLLAPGLAEPLAGPDITPIFLGMEGESPVFALDISAAADPEHAGPLAGLGAFAELRGLAMGEISAADAAIAGQAKSLVDWHARHRFCAQCGAPTAMTDGGYKRVCAACGAEHFPRTDPVVIMLAVHEDRCLLGRQPRFPAGFYSALAGFVEPGETIEEAVRRETLEEAGIRTGAVSYYTAQPWPFPSSLMIGCFAEALTTAITIDGQELADAQWFAKADVRRALAGERVGFFVPPPVAIAHHLVKAWAEA